MSEFGILLDERFKQHLTGAGHPERPVRLDAIRAGLEWEGVLSTSAKIEPQPIDLELVHRLHTPEYTARAERACKHDAGFLDCADTAISAASWDVARLAAGGAVAAARHIGTRRLRRAFCAVRPPGHHAEADQAMGFCLLNNVALAAQCLLDEFGFERICIVDWDVHHGNGTQHLFEADPRVLFISIHTHPQYLYPGTGYAEETGRGAGAGFTLNVPLMPGGDDAVYAAAFEREILPRAAAFEPQVVLISAGFDAHRDDPLGNQCVSDDGFDWMTKAVTELADRHAEGRVLSVLEGGYDLDVLRRCVAAHVLRLAAEC